MGGKVNWSFYNPVKIQFGRDCRKLLLDELTNLKLLVVTTKRGKQQFSEDIYLAKILQTNQVSWVDTVKENPDLADLQQQITKFQGLEFDALIAFGGGSSLDAAKALRMGIACQGQYQLAELIKQPGLVAAIAQMPLYTLPTTSGTGSEVTPFATVWNHAKKQKLSLASDQVFPTQAFVDPALTDSLPTKITVSTGLDAINQAAESIWNKNATPLTLAYATRALKLGLQALSALIEDAADKNSRDALAEASLLAGLAISHTRTALCHSISYPLTAHFGIPHGLACAFTMPAVCAANIQADDGRFIELANNLIGSNDLNQLVKLFKNLNKQMQVTEQIKQQVNSVEDILKLQNEMFTPGRADNNLSSEIDLENIINTSWNS